MEMARTASQIAFLKQGKSMAEGVCASSLRQDEFGIFQKQSLILQDKMKKRYERQKVQSCFLSQIPEFMPENAGCMVAIFHQDNK